MQTPDGNNMLVKTSRLGINITRPLSNEEETALQPEPAPAPPPADPK
jgi:hypothetical protein